MPVITEPFQTLPVYDKATNRYAWIHQPKVTILVKVHGQLYPYTIEAFVDSSATRNLFPADVLTYLHIPVDNGQKKIHYGIGGITVVSYTHEPVPKIKLGLVKPFNKLRTNGFLPFMVSLLNHQSLKHPDLGWLH
jgi:hypothetical protein